MTGSTRRQVSRKGSARMGASPAKGATLSVSLLNRALVGIPCSARPWGSASMPQQDKYSGAHAACEGRLDDEVAPPQTETCAHAARPIALHCCQSWLPLLRRRASWCTARSALAWRQRLDECTLRHSSRGRGVAFAWCVPPPVCLCDQPGGQRRGGSKLAAQACFLAPTLSERLTRSCRLHAACRAPYAPARLPPRLQPSPVGRQHGWRR